MFRKLVILSLAASFLAPALSAQIDAGATEFQLQGNIFLGIGGSADTTGTVAATWGRFLSRKIEIGGTGLAVFSDSDFSGLAGPFARYNFEVEGRPNIIPYIGSTAYASLGGNFFADSDLLLNLEGGARWMLRRDLGFTVSGSYLYDIEGAEFTDFAVIYFGFSRLWLD